MIGLNLLNQYEAALSTLNYCIINCPDGEWDQKHEDAPFCQVVFHALFYVDFYLENEEDTFKEQEFHKNNTNLFRDYEELEYQKAQNLYSKNECNLYLRFILEKCKEKLLNVQDDKLLEKPLIRPSISNRLELHIYSIRHIQHHAAQLGFRLQLINNKEMIWYSSGWKE